MEKPKLRRQPQHVAMKIVRWVESQWRKKHPYIMVCKCGKSRNHLVLEAVGGIDI